jgi:hypothetical protein
VPNKDPPFFNLFIEKIFAKNLLKGDKETKLETIYSILKE